MRLLAVSAAACALLAFPAAGQAPYGADASDQARAAGRGEYIFRAAGCEGCHTDVEDGGAPLAGGRRLETPFGTFVTPNITPDAEHGIGAWSEEDFVRALRHGRAPWGAPYYPAFPYTSYAAMTAADARDLFAYIRTVAPADRANARHELEFSFRIRWLVNIWRWLNFDADREVGDPSRSESWNRGAYLVEALGHCAECHAPRNLLGAVDRRAGMAGNPEGPEGGKVPAITPEALADWAEDDIVFFLAQGVLPDGDYVGGAMTEVIENSTSRLRREDLEAIALYLKDPPRQ